MHQELDILVNNAGITSNPMVPIAEQAVEELDNGSYGESEEGCLLSARANALALLEKDRT